jgi:excisionase family DNA binding protein
MKQYLNIAELSERLRVKRSTVYAWAEQGKIPHLKLGRLLRFDPDKIEVWLQTQERESKPQLRVQRRRRRGSDHVDDLIAHAKRDTYTSTRGIPDQDRATGKGEADGSV